MSLTTKTYSIDDFMLGSSFPVENNLVVQGNTVLEGRLQVDGRDILKELDELRDSVLLIKRDIEMESRYPKLRELKDAYETQLEKYRNFEALK